MGMLYMLEGTNVIHCPNTQAWAEWFKTANRVVAKDTIGDVTVSTVFLGVDHGLNKVQLFERVQSLPSLLSSFPFCEWLL